MAPTWAVPGLLIDCRRRVGIQLKWNLVHSKLMYSVVTKERPNCCDLININVCNTQYFCSYLKLLIIRRKASDKSSLHLL